jgi:hypothetical protein
MTKPPIAIFHYQFPFNDAGEQVWNWRQVECFTIEGNGPGAVKWHVLNACDDETSRFEFRVEWLDTHNGRTITTEGTAE